MKSCDLILDGIRRISFGLAFRWEDDNEEVRLIEDGNRSFLRDRFKFDEPASEWLFLEMSAPNDAEPSCPGIDITIRFPHPIEDPDYEFEALTMVNEMNKAGCCCSASFDHEDRGIYIRSNIVYSGYHDYPGQEEDYSHSQSEATLNFLAQVFGVAKEWEPWIRKLTTPKAMTARSILTERTAKRRASAPTTIK